MRVKNEITLIQLHVKTKIPTLVLNDMELTCNLVWEKRLMPNCISYGPHTTMTMSHLLRFAPVSPLSSC